MPSNKNKLDDDTPTFSDWLGSATAAMFQNEHVRHGLKKMLVTSHEARSQLQQWVQTTVEQLPLANKEDIDRLVGDHEEMAERLYNLEERLFEMERKLDEGLAELKKSRTAKSPQAKSSSRTRKSTKSQ